MVDLMNSGMLNLVSLAVSLLVAVVGLIVWFFVHRASSRANEQIELLEALLDQQKRQTTLLRRLCEANEPEREEPVQASKKAQQDDEGDDFIRLVAER
ncbi:hypothetical protein B5M10_22660 [Pluralibacter gergoviae]|uniref:YebO family protein n=1 Tax=Pluralibacter gergoviae TaxID=61647 RepID=UPI0005ED0378|nr:YebO family protein [Pluralibacter gergoviae]KJM62761.1 hypothetical protein SS31_14510 [Pluralibacter gergoviae]KMK17191.1 hypothetical protein ABW09_15665 [Pluralibacter gergoviae]KOR01897.1 hypothetical protein ABW48_06820 [Pluralibacter gergoviae]OUQ93597.1 hypothetical protein B5M10_22660 [Pluralibacter gergoviae]